jgi:hypothetical protein
VDGLDSGDLNSIIRQLISQFYVLFGLLPAEGETVIYDNVNYSAVMIL